MIVLKYMKQGEARYISHIDLLRHMTRIVRRANIPVKRSNGFNPHFLVFFSPPSVLGVQSDCEYVAMDADISGEEALERYNASVPQGLRATRAFEAAANPNLQGRIVAADYVFDVPYTDKVKDISTVRYLKKGEWQEEKIQDRLLFCGEYEGKLLLRLAQGNVNLRPDRLLLALGEATGKELKIADVKKIAQYVLADGALVNVDDALK